MTTRKNIKVLENAIRKVVNETKNAEGIRQEIEDAYKAVKEVKRKLRELGKTNGQTKVLKNAARKMVDELEDLEDLDMEEEVTEQDEETIKRNEQSEGYGSWEGLGMNESKIIKLTESDMGRLLNSVTVKKNSNLKKEINYTLGLIRNSIVKEGITSLNINSYRQINVINEQSEWSGGRNPGSSAASGIENIITTMKRAYQSIKDSTTRKQIENTLVKLNNFMVYSAELVGSGSSQRAPRSYDQVSNPIPYPELDEPEDLEDIDDGLEIPGELDEGSLRNWLRKHYYGGRFKRGEMGEAVEDFESNDRRIGSVGNKKQKASPSAPTTAPPCTPPNGPGGNGLGIHANAAGASLGTGCCGKCDNLPNPAGPFTPAELTYLGPCAPHCGCC